MVVDECHEAEPPLYDVDGSPEHRAACIRANELVAEDPDAAEVFDVEVVEEAPIAKVPREQRPVVLDVRNLVKHFPLTKGVVFKRRIGTVHAVDGASLRHPLRRDAGPGRRVGLRQDDHPDGDPRP